MWEPIEIYEKYKMKWPLSPGEGTSPGMTRLQSGFLTLIDNCHAHLTHGAEEFKQGPFCLCSFLPLLLPLLLSFYSFVLFMELIHLPAVLCQGRDL